MAPISTHTDAITTTGAGTDGCEDCLKVGGRWLHLRRCVSCGHVGCCDNSPNRHATAHFAVSDHPLIQSFEPGEEWLWCYVDEPAFEVASDVPSPSHPEWSPPGVQVFGITAPERASFL